MKALRASLVAIGLLTLSAATLSAQSTRISCKDGSKPKIGHFSCWGHGGLVREAAAIEPVKTPKAKAKSAAKKASVKKPAAAKATKKKSSTTPPATRSTRLSAK